MIWLHAIHEVGVVGSHGEDIAKCRRSCVGGIVRVQPLPARAHHHPRRNAGAGTELTLDGRVLDERGKCAPGEQLRAGPRQGPEQVRDHRGRQQEEEDRKGLLDRVELFDPFGKSLTAGRRDQDPKGSQHGGEGRENVRREELRIQPFAERTRAEKSTPRFSFAVSQPGFVPEGSPSRS